MTTHWGVFAIFLLILLLGAVLFGELGAKITGTVAVITALILVANHFGG